MTLNELSCSLGERLSAENFVCAFGLDGGRVLPRGERIEEILLTLKNILLPRPTDENEKISARIREVGEWLIEECAVALLYREDFAKRDENARRAESESVTSSFLSTLPTIREMLACDLVATYEGDPAATGVEEILLAYPGFFAIMTHRIAHELYIRSIPLIPRMMSEYAHRCTGIDIHPGALLGRYFSIDHGTGVVIGESTVIGERVKIYQGVTLGALSTRKGQGLRGVKRHPAIEDGVTIYSGASILGGDTVIGHDSIIGGNVFLTSSVLPNSRVYLQTGQQKFSHSEE